MELRCSFACPPKLFQGNPDPDRDPQPVPVARWESVPFSSIPASRRTNPPVLRHPDHLGRHNRDSVWPSISGSMSGGNPRRGWRVPEVCPRGPCPAFLELRHKSGQPVRLFPKDATLAVCFLGPRRAGLAAGKSTPLGRAAGYSSPRTTGGASGHNCRLGMCFEFPGNNPNWRLWIHASACAPPVPVSPQRLARGNGVGPC